MRLALSLTAVATVITALLIGGCGSSGRVPSATHRPAERRSLRPARRTVNENGRKVSSTRREPRDRAS